MARTRKSSIFSPIQTLKSMAKITTANISHDKAIELLGQSLIMSKQTELTTQMNDKLIRLLAPTGGRTRTAPATIATAAQKVVVEVFSMSRCDMISVKIPTIEAWVKELKQVCDDVPHFQDEDDLDLIGEISNKKHTCA